MTVAGYVECEYCRRLYAPNLVRLRANGRRQCFECSYDEIVEHVTEPE